MKLLVWNIRQGGGSRRQRIADCMRAHNPDIVALIEFLPSTSAPLLDAGFEYRICTKRNGFDFAVCVLSKTPIRTLPSGIPVLDDSGLWLEIVLPAHGFAFGVVHVPTKSRTVMKRFLDALVQVAARTVGDPFLLVGDFNTGIGPADGPMNNFGDVDRFLALQECGFSDLWRRFHGDGIEHTWCRNEKSYRIDHALASPGLLPRVRSCGYSHQERTSGVSDHSVLLVEIET
jgi:endonuclease/exonuclease/phosphatase family metal-dependent hydrolase